MVFGNCVDLGRNVVFVVNKEIVIEDDVNVARSPIFPLRWTRSSRWYRALCLNRA